ncbi:MAG: dTDP-4-dehydrorhamnose 3,5-epimerase family protein [Candidatus Magasanikbacteria bacterium]|jgi:dTDP-4-dehydrorhamnose 3,5-epimerase
MKIIEVKNLIIPDVKVVRFERFVDSRGYFTEMFHRHEIDSDTRFGFLKKSDLIQINESFVKAGVIKGLHFQWQPPLGKLLRVISGHMIDMVLDIRKGSLTEGKIILYDMPVSQSDNYGEWIWLPPGIAHGNIFLEDSIIEYLFTAPYNSAGESSIFPFSEDIDWSLCDPILKDKFKKFESGNFVISDKDKTGQSFLEWNHHNQSKNFIYV